MNDEFWNIMPSFSDCCQLAEGKRTWKERFKDTVFFKVAIALMKEVGLTWEHIEKLKKVMPKGNN